MRKAIELWWHDCTASALGEARSETMEIVSGAESINELDHSLLLPGDLAVTRNGVHVMAFLGENRWIGADPGAEKVIIVPVPERENVWFKTPVKIVRWRLLGEGLAKDR